MQKGNDSKKIAVFDIDGTLFRWQLYYEVVLKLLDRDFFTPEQSAAIRKSFHGWQSRESAFHEFETTAIPALEAQLSTLTLATFREIVDEILKESNHKVYSYTRNLAVKLKQDGYFLLAISGSMQEIAEPFAKKYGFDDCIGWIYERHNEHFTGKTLRVTVGKKAELLKGYVKQHGFSFEGSVGIGDSAGDIDMLGLMDRPIAFNPNDTLLAAASKHDWEVVIERKNIAYTLRKEADGPFILAQTDRL